MSVADFVVSKWNLNCTVVLCYVENTRRLDWSVASEAINVFWNYKIEIYQLKQHQSSKVSRRDRPDLSKKLVKFKVLIFALISSKRVGHNIIWIIRWNCPTYIGRRFYNFKKSVNIKVDKSREAICLHWRRLKYQWPFWTSSNAT